MLVLPVLSSLGFRLFLLCISVFDYENLKRFRQAFARRSCPQKTLHLQEGHTLNR
jgi:hypothetical protein